MGWKSSKEISRKKAISKIYDHLEDLSNEELGDVMSTMFGDNPDLPYCGYNFSIIEEDNEGIDDKYL